jgi:transglutaminase-like putative cysteine protease
MQSSDTLQYMVQSAVPNYTRQQLDEAPNTVPKSIADRYLDLPQGFSQRVRNTAEQLTAGLPSRWEKVLAIQDYLRRFTYSTDIQRGHGENALERFLYQTKKGYCEQFAAAAAAMARSIGIPARVAVGFTKGEEDPNKNGLFRVKGRNAHAWPEVWLQGRGWVQFEPTPGRGPDGAGDFLGDVSPGQDTGANNGAGPAPDPAGGQTTATTAPGGGQTTGGNRPGRNEGDVSVNESPAKDKSPVRFTVPPLGDVAKPAGAGFLAYLLLVPLGLLAQRGLRRARAKLPSQKVGLAWVETNEHALASGIDLAPSLTVAERATRLRLALPGAAGAIDLVARSVEHAAYAEVPPSPDEAARVTAASATIVAAANQRRTRRSRVLGWLDIRRLVPRDSKDRRFAGA